MVSLDEYRAQVNQYDAGRPTTPTADKPGIKPVSRDAVPAERFDASADAKMIARPPVAETLSQGMGRAVMGARPMQSYRGDALAAQAVAQTPQRLVGDIKLKQAQDEAQSSSLAANPARQMDLSGDKAMLVAAADTINRGNKRGPLPVTGESKDLAPGPLASPVQVGGVPDAKGNSFAGNFAAKDAHGQGIFKDPTTGRVSIKLTGDEGSKFMNERIPTARPEMMLSATEAKTDKPAQRPMGEYGGMYAQASPAEPVAQASTAAPAMTGNPLVDQKNMEAALQRKQMEVMAAERADKSLMQAPGSRDYISPMLTEEQQRARQVEISAQRKQDMRDARDNTIAQMEARDAALAYRGVPSDATRNQSMAPYAARRADINTRDAMLTRAQEQEKTGATVADNEATRAAEMEKAQLKDATDRYTADKGAELAQSTAEANAASKVLDRETTMRAAALKAENTKDPVLLKKLDGYNSWLESVMSMGQTPTPEQMTEAQKTYGVAELFPGATQGARVEPPAYR